MSECNHTYITGGSKCIYCNEPVKDEFTIPTPNKLKIAKLESVIELAYGLLWMSSLRGKKSQAAFEALGAALDHEAKGRGIKAAIDAGHEADHPAGCDYWAGMKNETSD